MRKVIDIPEYGYELHIGKKEIKCLDKVSKRIIDQRTLENQIILIQKKKFNHIFLRDTSHKEIRIIFEPLVEICSITTNAYYIRDIHMDSPSHGYYFGTYEIGEFSLTKRYELVVNRVFPIENCGRGWATPAKIFYFLLRESQSVEGPHSYFLGKLDWNEKPLPHLIWKKPVPSPILSLLGTADLLFLGLKDGTVQIWNQENEIMVKSLPIFSSTVSVLTQGIEKVIAASWAGETAAFSEDGHILWKEKITNAEIHALYEDESGMFLLDKSNNFFQLEPNTGEILDHKTWDFGLLQGASIISNMILVRNWFIAAGARGIWAQWQKDHTVSSHKEIYDTMIRQLYFHPDGFLSGDDTGKIRFWQLGYMRIKEDV